MCVREGGNRKMLGSRIVDGGNELFWSDLLIDV